MHLNAEYEPHHHCSVLVVTTTQLSVFEYLVLYLTCLDVVRFRRVWTKGNELQVLVHLGERHDTPFTGWVKCCTVGMVPVLLAVVGPGGWRICRSYAVDMRKIKSPDKPSCCRGWAIRETFWPMNSTLSTSWCPNGMMGFGLLTVMSIRCVIAISKCACIRTVGWPECLLGCIMWWSLCFPSWLSWSVRARAKLVGRLGSMSFAYDAVALCLGVLLWSEAVWFWGRQNTYMVDLD